MTGSGPPPDVAAFASAFTVPAQVAGTLKAVHIGPCVYGRFRGIFAYQVIESFNACGLRLDGTWFKYGDAFPTAQAAYEAVLASPEKWWGRPKDDPDAEVGA